MPDGSYQILIQLPFIRELEGRSARFSAVSNYVNVAQRHAICNDDRLTAMSMRNKFSVNFHNYFINLDAQLTVSNKINHKLTVDITDALRMAMATIVANTITHGTTKQLSSL